MLFVLVFSSVLNKNFITKTFLILLSDDPLMVFSKESGSDHESMIPSTKSARDPRKAKVAGKLVTRKLP